MLTMPTRHGWTVEWEIGKIRRRKLGNAVIKKIKIKDSFESESRDEVEAKQREMKEKGYKVSEIMQCIF